MFRKNQKNLDSYIEMSERLCRSRENRDFLLGLIPCYSIFIKDFRHRYDREAKITVLLRKIPKINLPKWLNEFTKELYSK